MRRKQVEGGGHKLSNSWSIRLCTYYLGTYALIWLNCTTSELAELTSFDKSYHPVSNGCFANTQPNTVGHVLNRVKARTVSVSLSLCVEVKEVLKTSGKDVQN